MQQVREYPPEDTWEEQAMRILVTGADQPLGREVALHLSRSHDVRATGFSPTSAADLGEFAYYQADLRSEEAVRPLVADTDAVIHVAEFDAPIGNSPEAEIEALDRAGRGTYVLCDEARNAGVDRVIVAGSLEVFDAYPDNYLIDEQWKPRPMPDARHMVPFLCETSAREFPREGGIRGVCLRFAPIGQDPELNTRLQDALHAVDCALDLEFREAGYRWYVFHIASSQRFLPRDARLILGFGPQEVE
jgi:nucleoside-diphosphate-sugar epimerase